MNRAGRKGHRVSATERQQIVLDAVDELCQKSRTGDTTMRKIAYRVGLQPSNYLMNVLWQLYHKDLIGLTVVENSRGNTVYKWNSLQQLELPF